MESYHLDKLFYNFRATSWRVKKNYQPIFWLAICFQFVNEFPKSFFYGWINNSKKENNIAIKVCFECRHFFSESLPNLIVYFLHKGVDAQILKLCNENASLIRNFSIVT